MRLDFFRSFLGDAKKDKEEIDDVILNLTGDLPIPNLNAIFYFNSINSHQSLSSQNRQTRAKRDPKTSRQERSKTARLHDCKIGAKREKKLA